MLAGKRAVRVGDQILKELSFVLLERVTDPRVKGVTVTAVKLSNDLKQARVFFSVIGGQEQINRAQAGLDSARGFIKREISMRMSLKYTPEIVFAYDPSLKSGSDMEKLFEKLKSNETEDDAG
jgi:ribosome-binding factor A